MATKPQKTIVEKLLDQKKIPHNSYEYGDGSGEFMDGKEVADAIGKPYEQVFKTLVCVGPKGNCVFVVPVEKELDLKKAAKISGQKSVEMIPVKDITKITGYIKGGCSPIGMKKMFPTYIDSTAQNFETIIFSAGKIGRQVEMSINDLLPLVKGTLAEITKEG